MTWDLAERFPLDLSTFVPFVLRFEPNTLNKEWGGKKPDWGAPTQVPTGVQR